MLLLSDGPLFHSMVTTPSHHTAAPTTAQLSSPLHLPQPPPICGSHISHLALYFQLVLTRQRVLTSASTGHLAQWVQNNGYWPQLFRVAQDSACFYGERIFFVFASRSLALTHVSGDAQNWLPADAADSTLTRCLFLATLFHSLARLEPPSSASP